MAIISIAKALLLLCALVVLLSATRKRSAGETHPLRELFTPALALLILAAFAVSYFWSTAPTADAVGSIAKYGKLVIIGVMLALIRSRREAGYALACFLVTQVFLAASSWLLYFHLPIPWATSNMALEENAVFSSYLDEGIITATAAAIWWHFRHDMPGRHGKAIAIAMAALCVLNVAFALRGRSGHVVAIAMISMAVMWEVPRRVRIFMVALPFVVFGVLFASSDAVRVRATDMAQEIRSFSYSSPDLQITSSGIRLMLWISSMTLVERHPLAGTGVGSFSTEYNRLEIVRNPSHQMAAGNFNPHQEYLLWGVQLGIPGILLFVALVASLFRDSLLFDRASARALQSVAVALALACLFNSSMYDALIGDFFCVIIGLLLAVGWYRKVDPVAPSPTLSRSHPSFLANQPVAKGSA